MSGPLQSAWRNVGAVGVWPDASRCPPLRSSQCHAVRDIPPVPAEKWFLRNLLPDTREVVMVGDQACCRIDQRRMPFRKIVQKAVDQANRRLAERMPRYALQEVAGYLAHPSFTRLQYELHLNGRRIGETLVIGLTRTNRVTAFLLPNQREVAEGSANDLGLDWRAVPLAMFDYETATGLMIRFVMTIKSRFPLG